MTTFDGTVAFQPIVDRSARAILAYEALAADRGAALDGPNLALALAARDGGTATLWLGVGAQGGGVEAALEAMLAAANHVDVSPRRLILGIGLGHAHLWPAARHRRAHALRLALDGVDPGCLRLLTRLRPDLARLDPALVRGLGADPGHRAGVAALARFCAGTGIGLVASGVDAPADLAALQALGIRLLQGNLIAPPQPDLARERQVIGDLDEVEEDLAWEAA